jgi:hypothetical protein
MKKKVVTIILAVAALTGCQKNIEEKNKTEVKATDPIDKELADIQKQLRGNHDLSLMVEKHNAVALWQGELRGKTILTINMQDSSGDPERVAEDYPTASGGEQSRPGEQISDESRKGSAQYRRRRRRRRTIGPSLRVIPRLNLWLRLEADLVLGRFRLQTIQEHDRRVNLHQEELSAAVARVAITGFLLKSVSAAGGMITRDIARQPGIRNEKVLETVARLLLDDVNNAVIINHIFFLNIAFRQILAK